MLTQKIFSYSKSNKGLSNNSEDEQIKKILKEIKSEYKNTIFFEPKSAAKINTFRRNRSILSSTSIGTSYKYSFSNKKSENSLSNKLKDNITKESLILELRQELKHHMKFNYIYNHLLKSVIHLKEVVKQNRDNVQRNSELFIETFKDKYNLIQQYEKKIVSLGEEKRSIVGFAFTLNSQVNKLAYNFINSVENKIIVNNYDENNKKTSIEIKSNLKQNNLIRFMEFSKKGQFLVVAAVKSRYLELFNSETGVSICKCDMESDSLNVKFICFSKDNDFLCCSLYGECFIFNIKSVVNTQEEDEEMGNLNNIEINRDIKLKIWSKFYLPEKKAICTFAGDGIGKDHIITIGAKGNYYLVKYDSLQKEDLALKIDEKYILKIEN